MKQITSLRTAFIDLKAFEANLNYFDSLSTAQVIPIIKANAYGHGLVEIAKFLESLKITRVGVADLDDAVLVRKSGFSGEILVWLLTSEFEKYLEYDFEYGISSLEQLETAINLGISKFHLKLDTGLSRNGFDVFNDLDFLKKVSNFQQKGFIKFLGVFSHFANTSNNSDTKQATEFIKFCNLAQSYGIKFDLKHLCATESALKYPNWHFDAIRIGIGCYGMVSSNLDEISNLAFENLKPVMKLTSVILNKRTINQGQGVSYNHKFIAKKTTDIALVPIGYADGLPRNARSPKVKINENICDVVGQIAMDQIMVDVTGIQCDIGDQVIIYDQMLPSVTNWANLSDTINYELLTRIGSRVKYEYLS